MFYTRVLSAICVVLSLAGCDLLSPFRRNTADWPWQNLQCGVDKTDGQGKPVSSCSAAEQQALSMHVTASEFCRAVHNRYESGANQAGVAQWLVSTTGTAAGLFALSSHGTATKVWAGLAGSTNAMQLAMSNALSATAELQRQSAVAQATRDAESALLAENDPLKRQRLAIRMTNECWMASANAEAKILEAINQLSTQAAVNRTAAGGTSGTNPGGKPGDNAGAAVPPAQAASAPVAAKISDAAIAPQGRNVGAGSATRERR